MVLSSVHRQRIKQSPVLAPGQQSPPSIPDLTFPTGSKLVPRVPLTRVSFEKKGTYSLIQHFLTNLASESLNSELM